MSLYNGEDLVRQDEFQTELGKLEAKLNGILQELQSQDKLLRLGLLSLASRMKKLEERALSREDIESVLDRYFDRKKRAQELLLAWGIPTGILGALLALFEFLRG